MSKRQELLNDVLRALRNSLKSLNSLIPLISVVAFSMGLTIVYIAGFHLATMMAIAIIIVLLTAGLCYNSGHDDKIVLSERMRNHVQKNPTEIR